MHDYCDNASNVTQNSPTSHVRRWNYPKNVPNTITELELDDKVKEIVRYLPQIGYRRLFGELKSKILGLPVTRPENLHNKLTRLESPKDGFKVQ